jgi:type II secretory pathway component PulC
VFIACSYPEFAMKLPIRISSTALIGLAEKRLVALLLAAVLCWRLAGWTLHFLAPPTPPSAPELRGNVNLAAVTRVPWFGIEAVAPERTETAPAEATDLTLIGVYAGGSRSSALIGIGSQSAAAFGVGDEIVSGARLTKVEIDHVLIDRNGSAERINLLAPVASLEPENQETPGKDTP